MCGRYSIYNFTELLEMFKTEISLRPAYNAAPTMELPIVTNDDPESVVAAKWGLEMPWSGAGKSYSMINARAESIDTKPAYKKSYEERRCIVPANGFYEWKKTPAGKVPFYFKLKNRDLMFFAGIWTENDGVRSFSIVTTDANKTMTKVHDRMPVILGKDWKRWLDSPGKDLLVPCADNLLKVYQVSDKANRTGAEGPELIAPITTLGNF